MIQSVVVGPRGKLVIFEDGTEYDANEWDDDVFQSFHPGGCLIVAPDGSETICSAFFSEHFLEP